MILDLPPQIYEQLTISAKEQGVILEHYIVKSSFEKLSDWQLSDKEYELLNQLDLDDTPNDELKALLAQGAGLV